MQLVEEESSARFTNVLERGITTGWALWVVHSLVTHHVAQVIPGGASALVLDRRESASRLVLLARATERALPLALTLSFLCVPAASARIFQTFLCDRFTFDDFEGTSKQYLHQDYALDCTSDEYAAARDAALVLDVVRVLVRGTQLVGCRTPSSCGTPCSASFRTLCSPWAPRSG